MSLLDIYREEFGLDEQSAYKRMWENRVGSQEDYQPIVEFVEKMGFKHVFDIGSDYGPYIKMFLDRGIRYTGIDQFPPERHCSATEEVFYDCDIITQRYPFPLKVRKKTSIAISVNALGSRLYDDEELARCQLQLAKDFNHFISRTWLTSLFKFRPFWKNYEIIELTGGDASKGNLGAIAYFYN